MEIAEVLKKYRRVAVVGISANPERPSHWIAKYLQKQGYEVVGVNPSLPEIEGLQIVSSLKEAQPLEIVDIFRAPSAIPELIEELRSLDPKVFWLQPGAENPGAEEQARKEGWMVISGQCIYQELQEINQMKDMQK